MIIIQGEGSANPTEPHHTPSPQEHHLPQHDSLPLSHQTIISEPFPQAPTETLTHRKYTRRVIRIARSKALSPVADEHASLSRNDRHVEAFSTVSSLDAGGIIDIGEELGAEKSTKLGSNDTEEMVNVLSSMEAANILSSGGAAVSVSLADVLPAADVPTVSGSFSTVSAIFTTVSVVTPYTRRPRGITIGFSQPMRIPIIGAKDKGKEKVIESEVPKKRKLQEQIDAQVAREMEEEFVRENQRLSKQLARDSEIARLHVEEELKIMIEGLDRSNEMIAKHLSKYEQAKSDMSVREKIELIRELVKYQDHHAKILKYQAQQRKPLSKKEQKEFYMSVLRSHAGWKTKHFRGMTLEQIKENFIPVWKQFEDFIPMSSKEESERVKRQGLKIDQGIFEGASEEELKGMMQLEEVYIEALQVKHLIIDWEIYSEGMREYWKIFRLGGHTAVYQFFVNMLK
nr:hypothetical protein [Tanacetum cinerariifolium]